MTPMVKLAAAAAAIVVVVVAGAAFIPRTYGPGGPSPTPSPIPSPSSAILACDGSIPACNLPLGAGTHTTVNFEPALTFTVPEGWSTNLDIARTYRWLEPDNRYSVEVISHLAIPDQRADCEPRKKVGVGNAVADWVTFLTTHPGLVASTPEPTTVGGYSGTEVSFHVGPTWTMQCQQSITPAVLLATDDGAVPERRLWIDDHYVTFFILDVAGKTVIFHVESGPSTASHEQALTDARPLIDSLRFAPGA